MAHPDWQRHGHTATVLPDGRVLVVGGRHASGGWPIAEYGVLILDPGSGTWTPAAPTRVPRANQSAIDLANGRVLVVGGDPYPEDPEQRRHVSAECYNPARDVWEDVAVPPDLRLFHIIGRFKDGRVLTIGSSERATEKPSLMPTWVAHPYTFDPASSTWTRGAPVPDVDLGAMTLLPDGRMLCSGGLHDHFDPEAALARVDADADPDEIQRMHRLEISPRVWLFNPAADTWTARAPMSVPRASHTLTPLADGCVLATGGQTVPPGTMPYLFEQLEALASTEIYDPVADRWTAATPLPAPRVAHHALALTGGRFVLVIGGDRLGGSTVARTVHLYDSADGQWHQLPRPAMARHGDAVVRVPPRRIVDVGGNYHEPLAECLDFAVQPLGWRPLPRMAPGTRPECSPAETLVERWGHAATVLPDGSVIVAGGERDQPTWPPAEPRAVRYVPAERRWVDAGRLPHPVDRPSAVLLRDGRVALLGGDGWERDGADVQVWDPPTSTWSVAAPLTCPRSAVGAVVLPDGRVMAIGGRAHRSDGDALPYGATGDVEISEPTLDAWHLGPPLTTPRMDPHVFALTDGSVLVVGGTQVDARARRTVGSIERLDAGATEWRVVASLPEHTNQAVQLSDGRILAFGGGAAALYDPADGAVRQVPGVFASWPAQATRLPDGRVVSAYAQHVGRSHAEASVAIFDPASLTWTTRRIGVACRRYWHTVSPRPDGTLLLVGGEHAEIGAEILDLAAGTSRIAS